MFLSAVFFTLLAAPASAAEVRWWVVREKVAIGATAREPAPSAEDACAGLRSVNARTCKTLAARATEAIAADHALSVRLQGEGAVFSYRGMMLIGGIGPGYGDILISVEPMVFE